MHELHSILETLFNIISKFKLLMSNDGLHQRYLTVWNQNRMNPELRNRAAPTSKKISISDLRKNADYFLKKLTRFQFSNQ